MQKDELVESGYESKILFQRLKVVEASCLVLNVIIFVFSIVYYEMIYEEIWGEYQMFVLVLIQLTSIFLSIQTIIRFKLKVELMRLRHKLRKIEGISEAGYAWPLAQEIIIGLLHPYIFLHN